MEEPLSTPTTPPVAGGQGATPVDPAATPDPAALQAGAGEGDGKTPAQSPKFDEAYVKDLRAEAANSRKAMAELQAKLKGFEDAKLSDEEKRTKELTDLRNRSAQLEAANRELHLRSQVARRARELSIVDEDAAYKLLDPKAIAFDADTGEATNIDDLLKALVKERKWLVASEPTQPSAPKIGTTNPARPPAAGALTKEQIARMGPDEINSRWAEVTAALAKG